MKWKRVLDTDTHFFADYKNLIMTSIFFTESTQSVSSSKKEKSNTGTLHGTIACQVPGSAGHVMVSISTHATPSSYTSCGQQHNNKATSLQISSASRQ